MVGEVLFRSNVPLLTVSKPVTTPALPIVKVPVNGVVPLAKVTLPKPEARVVGESVSPALPPIKVREFPPPVRVPLKAGVPLVDQNVPPLAPIVMLRLT